MSWDLGAPISYLALPEGVPVLTADGHELGEVRHVLADVEEDIFDGLVVRTRHVPPRDVFVDAPLVEELHERGVLLSIEGGAAEELPEPTGNPPIVEATPDDAVPDRLSDKLRRAWDLLSGNY